MARDLASCPKCGGLAVVLWRCDLPSTDGPVEHAKVTCVRRHHHLIPVTQLALR